MDLAAHMGQAARTTVQSDERSTQTCIIPSVSAIGWRARVADRCKVEAQTPAAQAISCDLGGGMSGKLACELELHNFAALQIARTQSVGAGQEQVQHPAQAEIAGLAGKAAKQAGAVA